MLNTRHFDTTRFLGRMQPFTDNFEQAWQRHATGHQVRRAKRGEVVFRMGTPCDSFRVAVMG